MYRMGFLSLHILIYDDITWRLHEDQMSFFSTCPRQQEVESKESTRFTRDYTKLQDMMFRSNRVFTCLSSVHC